MTEETTKHQDWKQNIENHEEEYPTKEVDEKIEVLK